jgi:pyruvoyl-dependent arginine decarboxylase (PvlArgDC)
MPTRRSSPHLEIGCRIPKDYFWVIGWGESDVGIETGSYDAALTMAGIENFNVMLYTSVLPPEAVELGHLPDIHHGSVLESRSPQGRRSSIPFGDLGVHAIAIPLAVGQQAYPGAKHERRRGQDEHRAQHSTEKVR